jgi:type IV secretion system protein VirB6
MFTKESWYFFNDYLFQAFLGGTDYLIQNSLEMSSSVNNTFGFIDPMLSFYFNSEIWSLIAISFFCFWKGTTVLAILSIIAMINLIAVILDIMIKYILAILSICILISLAPLFIIFTLFKSTRPIFDNWISSLVRYTLEPVLMFIFFLMIQQILMKIIPQALIPAEWTQVITVKINFNIDDFNVPLPVPGVPGIAFYTPKSSTSFIDVLSSTFILICLSKMVRGFVNYSSAIIGQITGAGVGTGSLGSSITHRLNTSWGIDSKNRDDKEREQAEKAAKAKKAAGKKDGAAGKKDDDTGKKDDDTGKKDGDAGQQTNARPSVK